MRERRARQVGEKWGGGRGKAGGEKARSARVGAKKRVALLLPPSLVSARRGSQHDCPCLDLASLGSSPAASWCSERARREVGPVPARTEARAAASFVPPSRPGARTRRPSGESSDSSGDPEAETDRGTQVLLGYVQLGLRRGGKKEGSESSRRPRAPDRLETRAEQTFPPSRTS